MVACEGFLREALSSLYTFFTTTREILRRYGPDVAPPLAPGHVSEQPDRPSGAPGRRGPPDRAPRAGQRGSDGSGA
ncbi:hypothetical protein CLM62_13375 [Streptomyces sp. SA15]|nr:hypothetical protein CLM62_13375 [Streptomyces sp. SA15]